MGEGTHDFIDDAFVGVEIEGETGVAGWITVRKVRKVIFTCTYYFSMRTREALLVVLVRTRPYRDINTVLLVVVGSRQCSP
jgi:hypothetical protein